MCVSERPTAQSRFPASTETGKERAVSFSVFIGRHRVGWGDGGGGEQEKSESRMSTGKNHTSAQQSTPGRWDGLRARPKTCFNR